MKVRHLLVMTTDVVTNEILFFDELPVPSNN
jgi:hypothetical protein